MSRIEWRSAAQHARPQPSELSGAGGSPFPEERGEGADTHILLCLSRFICKKNRHLPASFPVFEPPQSATAHPSSMNPPARALVIVSDSYGDMTDDVPPSAVLKRASPDDHMQQGCRAHYTFGPKFPAQ